MKAESNIPADARGLRVAIVVSAYHHEITEAMEVAATAGVEITRQAIATKDINFLTYPTI